MEHLSLIGSRWCSQGSKDASSFVVAITKSPTPKDGYGQTKNNFVGPSPTNGSFDFSHKLFVLQTPI